MRFGEATLSLVSILRLAKLEPFGVNLTFDELQNFGSKLNKPLLQGTFSSGNALFFSATAGVDVPVNSNLYINDSVYITTTYGYTTQQNILCNATRVNTIATIKSSTSLNIPFIPSSIFDNEVRYDLY